MSKHVKSPLSRHDEANEANEANEACEALVIHPWFSISLDGRGNYYVRDDFGRPCFVCGDAVDKGLLIQTADGIVYQCRVVRAGMTGYLLYTQQRAQQAFSFPWYHMLFDSMSPCPVPKALLDAAAAEAAYVEFYNPYCGDLLPSPAYVSYLRQVCAQANSMLF